MRDCDAVNDQMIAYRNMYDLVEGSFDDCELMHVGRASNEEADTLANIGSTCAPIQPGVLFEQIFKRSIKVKTTSPPSPKVADPLGAAPSTSTKAPDAPEEPAVPSDPAKVYLIEPLWTTPYVAYLAWREVPEDPTEARRVIRRSKAYTVINGELYKRSISGILQRCIAPEDGKGILLDIHEGTCGHHARRAPDM